MRFFEAIDIGPSVALACGMLIVNVLTYGCHSETSLPTQNLSRSGTPNETPIFEISEPRKVENKTLQKPGGWPIPDMGRFTKKSQSRKMRAGQMLDKIEYSPNSDVVYDARRDWAPSEATEHWLLRNLVKFESRGKALAYYFIGYKVSLKADGTVENRIATAVGIVISDRNSDGIFESLDFVGPGPEAPLSKIPSPSR